MSAIGAVISLLVNIGDALFQKVGNKVAILNGLFEAVGINRLTKILVSVAAFFIISKGTTALFEFARGRGKTKLQG